MALAALLLVAACGDNTGPEAVLRIEQLEPAPVAGSVVVRFSGAVTLPAEPGAFVLLRATDTVAAVVVQRSARVLELRPRDVLDLGATYTVRLSGVRSANGGAPSDSSWTFTTAGTMPPAADGARLFAVAEALAHDSMQGRAGGSADELRAAEYLRGRMLQAGLVPHPGTGWFQQVPLGATSSQNVLGVVPGAGALADEWVVIGAHYDHIGVGAGGVYNGADDNASGTSGMLEIARVLAAHAAAGGFGAQPRRSVLFAGFGAEELGLLGSNWFCSGPPMPLASVAGMLNLDMIGRLEDEPLSAHGVSSAPEWPQLLERYRGGLTITVGGLIGTDYRCFLNAGRPALALFTGLHPDYHRVSDDAPLLDVDGMAAVTTLALRLATNLLLRAHAPGAAPE